MNLHIRISRSYSELTAWIASESYGSCVVYEHEADNEVSRTHCHIWVKNVKCSTDTLKNHVKKFIGKVAPSDWYFTTVNKSGDLWTDDVITYMSKGTLSPVFVSGWSSDEIDSFRQKWVSPPSPLVVQDGKLVIKRTVKETAKKTKRELIQEMLETYLPEMDTREIIELIRKVLIRNNEVLGMYKVTDFYDSLLCYGNKEKFVDMMVQKINSRVRV